MKPVSLLLGVGVIAALGACRHVEPAPVTAPATAVDSAAVSHCDAAKVKDAIGQLPMPQTQDWARTTAGADSVRVLQYNQPTTREFLAGRLNLVLDSKGNIASAHCG